MKKKSAGLGDRIRLALKNSKTTQRSLSKALGVSESNVTFYIQGTTEPSVEGLAIIADICNVSLDWLITGEGPLQRPEVFRSADSTGISYPDDQELTDEYVDKLVNEELPKYCAQFGVNKVVAERMLRETISEIRETGKLPEGDQFGNLGDMINDAQRRIEKRTGRHQQPVRDEE